MLIRKWPTLYGLDAHGKIKVWKIKVSQANASASAAIDTDYGQEDGEMQRAMIWITQGKNLGKANETTPFTQACLRATSKWNHKLKRNYFQEKGDLGKAEKQILLPMLALDYKKRGHGIEWPAFVQPKLNGVRCLAHKTSPTEIVYRSRGGETFSTIEHLTPWLLPLLGKGEILDGEIFTKELTFQQICAAVRSEKVYRPEAELLEFWVYDWVATSDFKVRSSQLKGLLVEEGPLVLVPTKLVRTEARMMKLHDQMVQAGYEGTIIRNIKGAYRLDTRSVNLQKYKDFIDEEFEIVGGKTGEGKEAHAVTFLCTQEEGEVFDCRPRGSIKQREQWFRDLRNLLGKKLTVRYQTRTDANIPYLPVGIVIRDYE